jgi:hypothetical protein
MKCDKVLTDSTEVGLTEKVHKWELDGYKLVERHQELNGDETTYIGCMVKNDITATGDRERTTQTNKNTYSKSKPYDITKT